MKFILPILSESDLAALPAAVQFMKNQKAEGFWLIHSPSICLSAPEGLKDIDTEIAAIQTAKGAAINRQDYDAAKSYHELEDSKTLDKDALIRGAYKTIPLETRQPLYDRALAVATKSGLNGFVDLLPDHVEPKEIFKLLETMISERWPEQIGFDDYVLAWPKALAQSDSVLRMPPAEVKNARLVVPTKSPDGNPDREAQLRKAKYLGVKKIANQLGVFKEGIKFDELIARVISKENEVAKLAAY